MRLVCEIMNTHFFNYKTIFSISRYDIGHSHNSLSKDQILFFTGSKYRLLWFRFLYAIEITFSSLSMKYFYLHYSDMGYNRGFNHHSFSQVKCDAFDLFSRLSCQRWCNIDFSSACTRFYVKSFNSGYFYNQSACYFKTPSKKRRIIIRFTSLPCFEILSVSIYISTDTLWPSLC